MRYWLLKSEPHVFSIDDLIKTPQQITAWEGVRNYQARNFMRQMMKGDLGFFYHSNAKPSGIAGIVEIVKTAYPDPTAQDKHSDYYDPKSNAEQPRWDCVDVKFVKKFPKVFSLEEIKKIAALKEMSLLHHSRLSVQPVTEKEGEIIVKITEQ